MKRVSLLLGLLLAVAGCRRPSDAARPDTGPVASVHTAKVAAARLTRTQAVAGTVRPLARATVAAKITGTVLTSNLVVGRSVTAGEVLVTLQAGELSARSDLAQAALAQAEREFERERTMEAQGAATTDSVRTADDHRRQARAAAEEATAMLAYTRIPAPFAGVITDELVKAGDLATPGRALFTIEGTDQLRAEVQVPESLANVALGQAIAVVLDDVTVTGTLAEISPAADPATRTRLAKVALPATSPARSGQFVRVLWPAGADEALTIPASALTVLGQMERVFVVTDQHLQLRLVKSGARDGNALEIMSGLEAGEVVVVDPSSTLRDGQRAEIVP